MADAHMTRPRNLFDLPNEILLNLVGKLVDKQQSTQRTLSSFRQTCKHAFHLAEQAWWRHIQLHSHTHCGRLLLLLGSHQLRLLHIQKLDIVPVSEVAEKFKSYGNMHEFILLCPSLTYLTVDTFFSWTWQYAINRELRADDFAELREFELKSSQHSEFGRADFMEILLPPKLTRLSLDAIDLRGLLRDKLPDRSSALKILKLTSCAVDDESITTMLRKPVALKVLEFGLLKQNTRQFLWSTRSRTDPDEEVRGIQLMLRIAGREQQGLPAIRLIELNAYFLHLARFKGALDLSQNKGLRELCLQTDQWSEYRLSRVFDIFDRLPSGIERIKIRTEGAIINDRSTKRTRLRMRSFTETLLGQ